MRQAAGLAAADRAEDAKILLQKALQREPAHAEAHYRLALLLKKEDRDYDALAHLRQAADSQPSYLVELGRAELQMYLENPRSTAFLNQARATAARLASQPAHAAEAARIEGFLALMERQPEAAASHFERALERSGDPHRASMADASLALIQQLLAAGRESDAQRWLDRLVPASPLSSAMLDTFYFHVLLKRGCPAAEPILARKAALRGEADDAPFALAAHRRRCQGPAAERAALASFRQQAGQNRSQAIRLGDYYAEQGKWSEALEAYETAASLPATSENDGRGGSLEVRRSSALLGLGRHAEAAPLLDSYLAQHPQEPNALAQRGLLRIFGRGPRNAAGGPSYQRGLEDLRSALRLGGERIPPSVRVQLAIALLRVGQLQEARREIQNLENSRSGSLGLELLRAELSLREGRPESSLKIAEQVLREAPGLREARLLRAVALRAVRRDADALRELRQLAEAYPEDDSIAVQKLAALAALLPEGKLPAEFARDLARLESQGDLELSARSLLAEVLFTAGQTAKAVALWDRLYQESASPPLLLRAAEVRLSAGQTEAACQALDRVSHWESQFEATLRSSYWGLQAICHEKRGRIQEALSAHRQALALRPADPVLSNNLASFLATQGRDLEEALALAQAAVQASPDEIQYLDTLGWVLHQKKDLARSRQIYLELAKRASLPPEILDHVSKVLPPTGTITR